MKYTLNSLITYIKMQIISCDIILLVNSYFIFKCIV